MQKLQYIKHGSLRLTDGYRKRLNPSYWVIYFLTTKPLNAIKVYSNALFGQSWFDRQLRGNTAVLAVLASAN